MHRRKARTYSLGDVVPLSCPMRHNNECIYFIDGERHVCPYLHAIQDYHILCNYDGPKMFDRFTRWGKINYSYGTRYKRGQLVLWYDIPHRLTYTNGSYLWMRRVSDNELIKRVHPTDHIDIVQGDLCIPIQLESNVTNSCVKDASSKSLQTQSYATDHTVICS